MECDLCLAKASAFAFAVGLLVLLCALDSSGQRRADFCRITQQHFLCQQREPSPNCGQVYQRGISRQLAQDLVHVHNVMRSRVARGLVDGQGGGGKLPQAADMLELTNIATFSTSQRGVENFHQKVLDLAQTWIAESVYASVDFVNTFDQGCCHTGTYGHFAQAVWSITRYIGCGVVTHQGGLGTKVLLYCNYGPGGIVVSKPTYRMGRTCSACPQGTKCDSRYDGLCNVAS
ncbi:scoloptoxin SSD976-like [Pollicipes pollicipes]|uniref:scoloptoxin SSD976-like n=1 Tax=Pollicipes pollicipes TaxID=41117 RepID=UPI001884AFCD|nr:scoloptoxin SSD976-like [Pollicipes pollicipes]